MSVTSSTTPDPISSANRKEELECQKLALEIADLQGRQADEATKRFLEIKKLKRIDAPTWVALLISVLIATGGWSVQAVLDRRAAAERSESYQLELHAKTRDSLGNPDPAQRLSAAANLARNPFYEKHSDALDRDALFLVERLTEETNATVADQIVDSLVSYRSPSIGPLAQANARAYRSVMLAAGRCHGLEVLQKIPDVQDWNKRRSDDVFSTAVSQVERRILNDGLEGKWNRFYRIAGTIRRETFFGEGTALFTEGLGQRRRSAQEIDQELEKALSDMDQDASVFMRTIDALELLIRQQTGHLSGTDLSHVVLLEVGFSNLDMSGVVLKGARITGGGESLVLDQADLAEADLSGMLLDGAKIRNAKSVHDTTFPSGVLRYPQPVDFTGSNIMDSFFMKNGIPGTIPE